MALKATIFKAELAINDMDRHYYQTHALRLAQHPSETSERMMLRLLAFAMFADEQLVFGKGISTDDEPDLWIKDAAGDITLWIDLGLPSLDRVRKACARSQQVVVLTYGSEQSLKPWWKKMQDSVQRFSHLKILHIPNAVAQALVPMVQPAMSVQAMIQDGEIWFSDAAHNLSVQPESLK